MTMKYVLQSLETSLYYNGTSFCVPAYEHAKLFEELPDVPYLQFLWRCRIAVHEVPVREPNFLLSLFR